MLRSLPWDSTFDSPGLSSQAVHILVLWLEVLYITDPHLREILFLSWVLEQECCSHIHPYSALFPCMYQPLSSMKAMNLHCWHCTAFFWLSSGSVPSQDDVCPAVVVWFVPDCEVVLVWWSSRLPLPPILELVHVGGDRVFLDDSGSHIPHSFSYCYQTVRSTFQCNSIVSPFIGL